MRDGCLLDRRDKRRKRPICIFPRATRALFLINTASGSVVRARPQQQFLNEINSARALSDHFNEHAALNVSSIDQIVRLYLFHLVTNGDYSHRPFDARWVLSGAKEDGRK